MTPQEELDAIMNKKQSGDNETGNNEKTGNDTTQTPASSTTPPPPTPEPVKRNYDDFWGSASVNRVSTVAPAADTKEPGGAPSSPEAKTTGTGKVSRQAIETGARTAVTTINLAQASVMRPLLNWRFRKAGEKRYGENFEKGLEMIMSDTKPKDETEKGIKARIQRFLDQRDSKLTNIPFSDTEEKDMEYAFKAYFEMKQTSMSPEVLLYCSIGSILGKRAIDVFVWD